jgi:cell wall-associated NlpC family hydrolase
MPQLALIAVSVATLWSAPGIARPVDRPELTAPANPGAWTAALDTPARRWLVGRVQTQALLGEQVLVLGQRGAWSHVVVTDQPTPLDARGYPGWLPTRQLAAAPVRRPDQTFAVVIAPTTDLERAGRPPLELSYGTRLPLAAQTTTTVTVTTPVGSGTLPRNAVELDPPGPPQATGAAIVADARRFLGLRYLWGGRSAFGFDCSGLSELVYAVHGITLPRDADAQALAGRAVSPQALRPGDLLFFGRPHVHHVAIYAGAGLMLESPDSSAAVRLAPVGSRSDLAGARRLLG